ncbi:polysaccharide biosynthesis tyrosine autokinase [Sphingomonas sp. BN140010]|uniref:non-specific protein-tyrosine kinase n=1 Tax=Sphingomonas arvum TaxID=2992113 RepID=A0ABT3JD54_9SPHN|nr:polysaccharide biosynthesis tyrosine autokinase [Sphingomonas sp. BN140010]MCW3796992.1 polysaccharide biosynthesis tyrosine autokinase [Sphingomonas sp. BN140010]
MNRLITTSNQAIVPSRPFADLELLSTGRGAPLRTGLEEMLAAAYRQRFVILAALAFALAVGAFLALTATPRYTAVASVQVDEQTPQVFAQNSLEPAADPKNAERFLQTQIDLAQSRTIAEAVAANTQLARSPDSLKALGVDPAADPDTVERQVIAKLQDGIQVAIGLNTRVARISFTSSDRDVSARIANAFANSLIAANLQRKNQTSARAKQYLQQQLGEAKKRLEGSERKMLAYARSADLTTGLVDGAGGSATPGSMRAQQLGLMTASLAQATARRIDAQQQWAQVSRTDPLTLPEVQGNKAVQDLVAQRAQLQAALQEERQRHTDEHPGVQGAVAKIAELNGQIGGFASRIKASFRGEYIAAAQQERQIAGTVAGLRGATMSERERGVGFNSLAREVETNKAFYDGLLQRYKEVAAAAGAAAANISLVDPAWPPIAADSTLGRDLALAGVSGLLIALVVGGARERMHNVVRTTDDLEQSVHLASLGCVPRIPRNGPTAAALQNPDSAPAEAYHSIAVSLQQATPAGLPKTLLITSSTSSEGKSTSALGIARSLAAMGKRVIVVDADLRRARGMRSANDEDAPPGFSDLLAGWTTARDAVQAADQAGVSIVPAGEVTTSPVHLLSADHMQQAFEELLQDCDIVIVDGPPIMGLADAVLLARNVEAVLVVVEANRTLTTEIDVAISRLPQSNIIGAVITKFDAKSAGVRYGGYNYYTYGQAS